MKKNKVVRYCFVLFLSAVFCLSACSFLRSDGQNLLEQAKTDYNAGVSYSRAGDYANAAYYLKQAEAVLSDIDTHSHTKDSSFIIEYERLLGQTWFYLGNTYESEMLYDIAGQYYHKSIPLLQQGKNDILLACAYRDIARTMAIGGVSKDSVLRYFSFAEQYAHKADNNMLVKDISAYRYQLCYPDSIQERLKICLDLATRYGAHARYSEIVELLLEQHSTDSAAFYLSRLQPADSSYAYWFEQTYAYLNSKVLYQRGMTGKAYNALLDLYDRKIDELQRDAGARTYALALHYDVAREQHAAEEARREKQWQRTISLVLVLVLTLVVALLFVLWRYWQHRRREQSTALQTLKEKYSQQLGLALERLKQKVNLTKEIELQRMRGNEPEFPKWLQTYRDEQLTLSKESLDELIASVDAALDGAISRLRSDYPALTESDMQFAILTIIGVSDSDMGILLNVRKQTIYHRRQIVRRHISADILDIDSWLREYALRL